VTFAEFDHLSNASGAITANDSNACGSTRASHSSSVHRAFMFARDVHTHHRVYKYARPQVGHWPQRIDVLSFDNNDPPCTDLYDSAASVYEDVVVAFPTAYHHFANVGRCGAFTVHHVGMP
jgi:hypothetical protein